MTKEELLYDVKVWQDAYFRRNRQAYFFLHRLREARRIIRMYRRLRSGEETTS